MAWSCLYPKSNSKPPSFLSGSLLQFITTLNVSALFIENYIIIFTLTSLQRLIHVEDVTQCEINHAKENYEKNLINNYAHSKDPPLY